MVRIGFADVDRDRKAALGHRFGGDRLGLAEFRYGVIDRFGRTRSVTRQAHDVESHRGLFELSPPIRNQRR